MAFLCVLLFAACVYDYLQNRIPNELLIVLFLMGIGWRGIGGNLQDVLLFPIGAAGVMVLLYPLFKIGCMGAGDVKLLGICAGYLPFPKILSFLFFSLLMAAAFSLIKMIKRHNTRERFHYLWEYFTAVLCSGKWQLYFEDGKPCKSAGICLSGPVFLSVLLYIGGVY